MTYADHITAAASYAAAALTAPSPTREAEVGAVRVLQDDLAAVLAEMTREITGLAPVQPMAVEVADVARHPVRVMLNRLNGLSRRAGYDEPAAAPSVRLAGRPATPRDAATALEAWKGLVAETLQARHILTGHAGLMGDEQRWAALTDVAALAEVLATTRSDLLAGVQVNTTAVRRDRSHAAALAVEAREVTRLAGIPTTATGTAWSEPKNNLGVVLVSRISHLVPAAANLGRLLQQRKASITDLLAITGLLAQTSRAAARALHAAARHDPTTVRAALPASAVLERHAAELGRALAAERGRLGALTGGSRPLLAQGREIGACALPRLSDLARQPARASGALPDLLAYAAMAPTLTRAIRSGVEASTRRHEVAIRDRAHDDAPYLWVPAGTVDLSRLQGNLARAATAGVLPTQPEPPRLDSAPVRQVPTGALARALEARQEQLRPPRPSTAALSGEFARVRHNGQARIAPRA